MLKELTIQEALQLLAEKYPEPVEGWFWNGEGGNKRQGKMEVQANAEYAKFMCLGVGVFNKFAIEVQDEERYMTQQEFFDWVVTVGYKGHQVKNKSLENQVWSSPSSPSISSTIKMEGWEYRTVELIDGKIVYGEPKEFKVKV